MDVINQLSQLEEFHTINDADTGLTAIIAIHNTRLGPALGGCRCINYDSPARAIADSISLARAMSYKAAISGLNQGGGKAVIIRPQKINDSKSFFYRFGEFVNSLRGKYITAVDSGVTLDDLRIIADKTNYVAGLPNTSSNIYSDPSYMTALGIRRGIEAAVKFTYDKDTLEGIHVAIQGIGKVGYFLAKNLYEQGARLTISDRNIEKLNALAKEINADVVDIDQIYSVNCDVFSPCALGGVINENTVNKIKSKIICGAANNQLANENYLNILAERNILYVPDYIVNAGGLICASYQYNTMPDSECYQKVLNIYNTLLNLFERSKQNNISVNRMADTMVGEILQQ